MSETRLVKFDGDTIEVFGTSRENAQVSVRHVCKALGLDLKRQLQKLRDSKWTRVGTVPTQVEGDQQIREYAVIPLEHLPAWLFKISPGRVKEQFREKLELYQMRARDVLAAAFLDAETGLPPALLAAFGAFMEKAQQPLVGRMEHFQQQLDRVAAVQLAAPVAHGPLLPRYTVQERLIWKGWPEATKDARRRIRKLAVARIDANFGETPDQAGGPGGGGPLRFYGAQLVYLDQAIDEVRQATLRCEAERERVTGPTLFTGVAG